MTPFTFPLAGLQADHILCDIWRVPREAFKRNCKRRLQKAASGLFPPDTKLPTTPIRISSNGTVLHVHVVENSREHHTDLATSDDTKYSSQGTPCHTVTFPWTRLWEAGTLQRSQKYHVLLCSCEEASYPPQWCYSWTVKCCDCARDRNHRRETKICNMVNGQQEI